MDSDNSYIESKSAVDEKAIDLPESDRQILDQDWSDSEAIAVRWKYGSCLNHVD